MKLTSEWYWQATPSYLEGLLGNTREVLDALIETKVQRGLIETDGSIHELALIKIQHENSEVNALGEFAVNSGQREMRFYMTFPRVDGPLDCFL